MRACTRCPALDGCGAVRHVLVQSWCCSSGIPCATRQQQNAVPLEANSMERGISAEDKSLFPLQNVAEHRCTPRDTLGVGFLRRALPRSCARCIPSGLCEMERACLHCSPHMCWPWITSGNIQLCSHAVPSFQASPTGTHPSTHARGIASEMGMLTSTSGIRRRSPVWSSVQRWSLVVQAGIRAGMD